MTSNILQSYKREDRCLKPLINVPSLRKMCKGIHSHQSSRLVWLHASWAPTGYKWDELTPIDGRKQVGNWGYFTRTYPTYRSYFTPFIVIGWGAHLVAKVYRAHPFSKRHLLEQYMSPKTSVRSILPLQPTVCPWKYAESQNESRLPSVTFQLPFLIRLGPCGPCIIQLLC